MDLDAMGVALGSEEKVNWGELRVLGNRRGHMWMGLRLQTYGEPWSGVETYKIGIQCYFCT